jgi:hypothetical protein
MNPFRNDLTEYYWNASKNDPQAFADMVRNRTLSDVALFLGALGYSEASGLIYGASIGSVNLAHYTKDV